MNLNFFFKNFALFFFSIYIYGDSFHFNIPNNNGVIGTINTPSARFYDAPAISFTAYRGIKDRKLTLSFYPYNWLDASLFYTSIKDEPYGNSIFTQDLKDKGFNLKLRLKKEDNFPAIAIGFNDFIGTGLYQGEYIVFSKGFQKLDIHMGLGWGNLNGDKNVFNPFTIFSDSFTNRPYGTNDEGGQLNFNKYFSGKKASIFGSLNYFLDDDIRLSIEYDPTETSERILNNTSKTNLNFGIDYIFNNNFSTGIFYEKGDYISFKFSIKDNFIAKKTEISLPAKRKLNSYDYLDEILRSNNIGVVKMIKNDENLDITFTQNSYKSISQMDHIVDQSIEISGVNEEVVKRYNTAGLEVINKSNNTLKENSIFLYDRKYFGYNDAFSFKIRPFIAGREDFLKLGLMLNYDSEFIFSENMFLTTNLKYSIIDNFNDLIYPPVDTYPNQVRSDVKTYLRELSDGISLGRFEIDYFKSLYKNNHILLTAGILEDMYAGYGFEYLNFDPNNKISFGFEAFKAFKRGYDFDFELLDYKNTTYFLNLFYKNRYLFDFDTKVSVGEYLAGDRGVTLEFSRRFKNGVEFGLFASFTDVSTDDFGEGSFDKGIFFTIPLGEKQNLSQFMWRPLTKDPGAKLIRKNNLYDIVEKYSIN